MPRARITRTLATIRENEGKVSEASELMQDLQVETFGSMERPEKVDFILEQMRLLKAVGDWDKLAIVAKKINVKWFAANDDEQHQELKLRYFALMVIYGLHTDKYLDVCKYLRAVYDTPCIARDDERWKPVLRNIVYFVVLAPFDNEQSDLLHRIVKDPRLGKLSEET